MCKGTDHGLDMTQHHHETWPDTLTLCGLVMQGLCFVLHSFKKFIEGIPGRVSGHFAHVRPSQFAKVSNRLHNYSIDQ